MAGESTGTGGRVDYTILAERFCNLWKSCGGKDPEAMWQNLRDYYQESHRHYHTLGHLAQCLKELDSAGDVVAERDLDEYGLKICAY